MIALQQDAQVLIHLSCQFQLLLRAIRRSLFEVSGRIYLPPSALAVSFVVPFGLFSVS